MAAWWALCVRKTLVALASVPQATQETWCFPLSPEVEITCKIALLWSSDRRRENSYLLKLSPIQIVLVATLLLGCRHYGFPLWVEAEGQRSSDLHP